MSLLVILKRLPESRILTGYFMVNYVHYNTGYVIIIITYVTTIGKQLLWSLVADFCGTDGLPATFAYSLSLVAQTLFTCGPYASGALVWSSEQYAYQNICQIIKDP